MEGWTVMVVLGNTVDRENFAVKIISWLRRTTKI